MGNVDCRCGCDGNLNECHLKPVSLNLPKRPLPTPQQGPYFKCQCCDHEYHEDESFYCPKCPEEARISNTCDHCFNAPIHDQHECFDCIRAFLVKHDPESVADFDKERRA